MKFKSASQTWSRGINAVQGAVGSPISNPIVENIHVSCEGEKVRFMATNLNLSILCEGEAEVEEAGEIVLPAKILGNIGRDLPQGDVFCETKEETVKIRCGSFLARFKGNPGELFPPFCKLEEGRYIKISSKTLKDTIRKTYITTTTDKARFELDGVKFDLKGKVLNCVSTDGRRLSRYQIVDEALQEEDFSSFLPAKTLFEVQKTLPDEGDVEIIFQEKRVQFSCGDAKIVSNLIVENFPPYEKIIPPPGNIKITFDKEKLLGAVKRASILSSQETNLIIVQIKSKEMRVFAEREEIGGEGSETISLEYEGEELKIRYNHKFLEDFLKIADEETVELEINDPRKPGIWRGVGNEKFLYVLMPLKEPQEEER
ncbi:MAG: DNA polymerase III subunit beta [Candidatus Omnitrophota bacterium]